MYETFFGLKRRPFLAVPDTESYFSIPQMEAAKQSIERVVRRGEGISLIVGPHGIGKTLLLRLLRNSLDVEYTVALIASGRLDSAKTFFQQLLYELHLPFSKADETELRLMLMDFARQETTPGIVLLFDEAQYLDRSVLDEILLLMNCDDGAMPFFRTVLAGTVDFEEKLTHPHLEAFNQRIVSRSYLDTMSRDETLQYISWQTGFSKSLEKPGIADGLEEMIRNSARIQEDLIPENGEMRRMDGPHVGFGEPIFSDEARRTVYRLTDGLPRLVNQLCDGAMKIAAEQISRYVDDDLIQSSWAQLQQIDKEELESITKSKTRTETYENIEEIIARKRGSFQLKEFDSSIEFGTLDDDNEPQHVPEVTEEMSNLTNFVASDLEADEETTEEISDETAGAECEQVYVSSVNQYKPPYPEDDGDEGFEDEVTLSKIEENETEAIDELENIDDKDLTGQEKTVFEESDRESKQKLEAAEIEEESCLIDAVDDAVFYENPIFVTETLEKLPFCEDLDQAIEDVATGAVEDEFYETEQYRQHGISLRYPIRYRNIKWDGPRRYKQRRKISSSGQKSETKIAENFASFSLTFRVFGMGDPWIGSVSTRLLYQPGRWAVDAIANLVQFLNETSSENMDGEDKNVAEQIEEAVETFVVETNNLEENAEEPDMDPETLKKYGAEILAGRPPFVRKEPNYVYQTEDHAPPSCPTKNAFPCFDPVTGNVIMLNWILPKQSELGGIGTVYRQFSSRESDGLKSNDSSTATQVNSQFESLAKFETSRVVRISMNSKTSNRDTKQNLVHRVIDEIFDEIVSVKRKVVSLDDVYKLETEASPVMSSTRPKQIEQETFSQQEIDSVIRRITEAAQKIEQAAETTEHAGQRICQSADFVETEVRTALPSYKELFMELSNFQKTLSEEMRTMKSSARAIEFVNLPVEQIQTWIHHPEELSQQNEITSANSVERGKLLPFPKRPDIVPPNPTSNQKSSETSPASSTAGPAEDDDSVDLRSLFQ